MFFTKKVIRGTILLLVLLLFSVPSEGANPCSATLGDDLKMVIPFISIGKSSLALKLDYSQAGPLAGSDVWFKLVGHEASNLTGCTNPASLTSQSGSHIVRIPLLAAAKVNGWVDLEYVPTKDGNIWFKVNNAGLLPYLVFITKEKGNGDFSSWTSASGKTGLQAADAVCQASAKRAGFSGTFVALVSDAKTDFYCRLFGLSGEKVNNCGQNSLPTSAGPWVRTDGFPFAPTADKLFEKGEVYVPVINDEMGDRVPQDTSYWTGTQRNGAEHWGGGENCSDWSDSSQPWGRFGDTDGTTSSWAYNGSSNCSVSQSLLCLQTGKGPALPAFASTGKKVFISSQSGNAKIGTWTGAGGNSGLKAADSVCQSLAQKAKLKNASNYKAWLSTSAVNALDRLSSNGPWVRLDGVKVAGNKVDLTDGDLFTAISLDEKGLYHGNFGVWTGTGDHGQKMSQTCKDWSDASSSAEGVGGRSSWVKEWSNDNSPSACDSTWLHLYCFED